MFTSFKVLSYEFLSKAKTTIMWTVVHVVLSSEFQSITKYV